MGVASLAPAVDQHIVPEAAPMTGECSGWAASGVQGSDNARWVELVSGRDRFGRHRGSAGSLMLNYGGYYAGSLWAYFGVENRDLFDGSAPWLDQALVDVARFICRGTYLRNLTTDLPSYKPGEIIKRSVVVENLGPKAVECTVRFAVCADGDRTKPAAHAQVSVTVEPGASTTVESPCRPVELDSDVYEILADLIIDGKPVDRMRRSKPCGTRKNAGLPPPAQLYTSRWNRVARRAGLRLARTRSLPPDSAGWWAAPPIPIHATRAGVSPSWNARASSSRATCWPRSAGN